ncbi:MAG: hypothetical protein KBF93_15975, partial [Leptospiraceae bacterium]|nr:hypothetical protein [Leptospiraceae bacterium]
KPQRTLREKHTKITKKIINFVRFVKTLVSFVLKKSLIVQHWAGVEPIFERLSENGLEPRYQ